MASRVTVPWSWEVTSALRPLSFMSLWLTPQLLTRKSQEIAAGTAIQGPVRQDPRPAASSGEGERGVAAAGFHGAPGWPRHPLRAVVPGPHPLGL